MIMEHQNLSSVGKKLFSLIEFDDDEQLVYEIRKHPIGLILIYFTGFFIALTLIAAFFGTTFFLDNDPLGTGVNSEPLRSPLIILGTILILLTLLMTFIGAYIYQSNVVLVTSEKLTQVVYRTIFDRKISQLSIGDVQDTTVDQKGILSRIFNYGTLIVETAGEQQNYTFTYVPRPYEASKAVVHAHEENLKEYGN